jgi:hypothetical protein
MIHHLSFAARDPQRVARVSAEFMGGVAVPYLPNALPSSGAGMISALLGTSGSGGRCAMGHFRANKLSSG